MSYKFANVERKLIDMAEDGMLSYEKIALACLAFMSEDDIGEMAQAEELIDFTEEEYTFEVRDDDDIAVSVHLTADEAEEKAQDLADTSDSSYTVFQVGDNGGTEEELETFYAS